MDDFSCDTVVVGAGLVGLAVARALALAGREVMILERGPSIGGGTSSRNSEVIHAGLYYPPDSLKAKLCTQGRGLLYDFAARHAVPFRQLGKWLVAAKESEVPKLEGLVASARANGVEDLAWLPAAFVRAQEPDLGFAQVVQSPSTGIVDSHALMLAFLGEAEANGAQLVRNAEVLRITPAAEGHRLVVHNAGDTVALEARLVVNSAGLFAQDLARATEALAAAFVPPLYLAKGSYAAITGRAPFRRLIYPLPQPGGLGVHLTLDMAGQARLGPDVEWLDDSDPAHIDYAVAPDIGARFAQQVQSWWPDVDAARLVPGYSGVRPKLTPPGEPAADFRLDGPALHGVPGLVNLFGIESPGLTSALAIARRVQEMLADA